MAKFVVGLTGGMASGKSTVARQFAALNITIVDSDAIAHQLTARAGEALTPIRQVFGGRYIDNTGALNRPAMRALVFADATQRKKLEAILHPMIRRRASEQIAQAQSPYVVHEIPLLVESGGHLRPRQVQRVLVVDCSPSVQITRACQRANLDARSVLKILASQSSRTERLQAADDIIDNTAELTAIKRQIITLHQHYLWFAHGTHTRLD